MASRVTLSVRVWIEIEKRKFVQRPRGVTLSVRVWIEMSIPRLAYLQAAKVTLSVRVWIEIFLGVLKAPVNDGHPQCEGVD